MRDRDITTRKHHFHHFLPLSLYLEEGMLLTIREEKLRISRGNFVRSVGKTTLPSLLFIYFSSLLSRRKRKFGILSLPWNLSRELSQVEAIVLSLFLSRGRSMEDGERSLVDDSPIPFFSFFWKTMFLSASGKMGETRGNKVKRQRP